MLCLFGFPLICGLAADCAISTKETAKHRYRTENMHIVNSDTGGYMWTNQRWTNTKREISRWASGFAVDTDGWVF